MKRILILTALILSLVSVSIAQDNKEIVPCTNLPGFTVVGQVRGDNKIGVGWVARQQVALAVYDLSTGERLEDIPINMYGQYQTYLDNPCHDWLIQPYVAKRPANVYDVYTPPQLFIRGVYTEPGTVFTKDYTVTGIIIINIPITLCE